MPLTTQREADAGSDVILEAIAAPTPSPAATASTLTPGPSGGNSPLGIRYPLCLGAVDLAIPRSAAGGGSWTRRLHDQAIAGRAMRLERDAWIALRFAPAGW